MEGSRPDDAIQDAGSGPRGAGRFTGTPRFELIARLGSGGMGAVYEAYDHEQDRRVALKVLQRMGPKDLLRFKNEYRLMRDIRHRNVIELGELFEHEGRWFFTMELIEGIDVVRSCRTRRAVTAGIPGVSETQDRARQRELRRRLPRFDEARLRSYFAQLARGLMALHASNTVHRDIKPSNVLVSKQGRVVVLDFGLAIGPGRDELESKRNVAAGTSEYMAPEQAAAKPIGPAADWYSVGCVLFQALTGRLPFTGSHLELSLRKMQHDPPSPSEHVDGIPPYLERLCLQLMARKPAARAGGEEILQALAPDEQGVAESISADASGFVGRAAELELLHRAFEDSRSGESVVVSLRGEAGIGKSSLLDRFIAELEQSHPVMLALAGRCYERESVPYRAIDEVVDSVVRYMAHLPEAVAAKLLPGDIALAAHVFPVLRRVRAVGRLRRPEIEGLDWRELRQRVFAAVRELMIRVAERGAVIVIIEDLQWADEDSRALLSHVFRAPGAPPCLIILSERTEGGLDGSTSQEATVASWLPHQVRTLEVAPLGDSEVAQLVRGLVGEAQIDASIDRIVASAAGHPLYVLDLVTRALAGGRLSADTRPEALLWERVEGLQPQQRALLAAVALAGGPVTQEVLANALSLPFAHYCELSEPLRDARLLRSAGVRRSDPADLYHDRVRAAVLEHLGVETRRRLHESLALAHEACGSSDDEALARHWFGAGVPDTARDYAISAAQSAADSFAFDRAARMYRFAIELQTENTTAASQRRLHARLGDVLANAGRAAEAAEQYLIAAVGSGEVASVELAHLAAEQLLCSGHVERGIEALRGVLEAVGMRMPESGLPRRILWGRLRLGMRGKRYRARDASEVSLQELRKIDVCWSAVLGMGAVDHLYTPYFQFHHLRAALRAGEPYRLTRAFAIHAFMRSSVRGSRGIREVNALIRRVEILAEAVANPHARALVNLARTGGAAMRCDFTGARQAGDVAERQLRETCRGVARELALTRQCLFSSLAMLGEFAELGQRLPASIRDADDRGDRYAGAGLRLGAHNQLWLAHDDVEGARAQVERGLSGWSHASYYVQHYLALVAQSHIDLYVGNAKGCRSRLAEHWKRLHEAYLLRMQFARIILGYARGRAALGIAVDSSGRDRTQHLRSAAADSGRLMREKNRCADLFAQLIDAGARNLRGDSAGAVAALEQAAGLAEELEMRAHRAAARRRIGERGGHSEQIRAADEQLAECGIANPQRFVSFLIPGF